MPKDLPTEDRPVRERGTYARHGGDPTLASYASSLFFLLSVPTFVVVAYAGYWEGFYPESTVIPVFTGLLIGSLAVVFAVMHVRTGK